jgi:putative oxidoreductase
MSTHSQAVLAAWGLLPLRFVVSMVFIVHGSQKLFVLGLVGTSEFMRQAGIPLPMLAAVVVSVVELLGGVAILVGLWVRWAALLLSVDMLVALLVVQLKAGLLRPGGFEFVFTLLGANLTLAALGEGKPSFFGRSRQTDLGGGGRP